MGYKTQSQISQVVDLATKREDGSPYQATIKVLGKGDKDVLQSILIGSRQTKGTTVVRGGNDTTTTIEQNMDNAAYATELIRRGTASWTLDDDAGAPLPITADTINTVLAGIDSDILIAAITALNEAPEKSGDAGA